MPFGKHRGVEVEDLPDSYISWLVDSVDLFGQLKIEVEREHIARFRTRKEVRTATTINIRIAPEDVELVRLVIDRGYRSASKLFHPDTGGDPQMMTRLNAVAESLRSQLGALAA